LLAIARHPERSGCCAKRSGHAVEGPLDATHDLLAARDSDQFLVRAQNSLTHQLERLSPRGLSTALASLGDANFAQDDRLSGSRA
jgi:hypothetical protein